MAIGRKPNTEDIGLNNTKIICLIAIILSSMNSNKQRTNIYAAGDCIGKLQLAHVGSKEGTTAIEHMFDKSPLPLDYNKMPNIVHTT